MVYIVRGLPGSGKTTFVKQMFPGMFHIENDMGQLDRYGKYIYRESKKYISIRWVSQCVREAIMNFIPVVISNVFVTKESVDYYVDLAKRYNTDYVIYRMTGDFKSIHNVPEDVYESMKKNFVNYPGEHLVTVDNSKLKRYELSTYIIK